MAQFQARFEALEGKSDVLCDRIQLCASQARAGSAALARSAGVVLIGVTVALLLFGALSAIAIRNMLTVLRDYIASLAGGVSRVADIAANIGASSRDVAFAANAQSESLDQTATSGDRIHSLARQNSTLSSTVAESVTATQARIVDANAQLAESGASMQSIRTSPAKISNIIQIIESIAFKPTASPSMPPSKPPALTKSVPGSPLSPMKFAPLPSAARTPPIPRPTFSRSPSAAGSNAPRT